VITADDIAAAVGAKLGATAAGGAWFLRAAESADSPYEVFSVDRRGEPEFESDGSYLQEWTVRAAAYSDQGAGADPNDVQLAMAGAMSADPTGWPALRDGAVLHCLPDGFDGQFSPTLRRARDTFVAGGQWRLLVSGGVGV